MKALVQQNNETKRMWVRLCMLANKLKSLANDKKKQKKKKKNATKPEKSSISKELDKNQKIIFVGLMEFTHTHTNWDKRNNTYSITLII